MSDTDIMELPVIQPTRRPEGQPPIFQRIGIVGLGLIGGSIALAARELWPASLVVAVDNKDVLETAMRLHAIDVAADDLIVLAEVDLVILAAPVRQNLAILEQLDEYVHQPSVVTDTSSTKREIVSAAAALPPRFTFIGGHPLGGAAASGLEHARTDLFRGRPWLFTPSSDAHGDALEKLLAFARALGAEPRVIGVDAHDRLLAFLSHLPQLTASALMAVVGAAVGADGLALAGRGLVDTTRLASSPAEIWKDIAATNADEIGPALDTLIALLQELRADLQGGDRLAEVFREAAAWRQTLTNR
ncbi:MAG TPA: prephenate dehydrogenase/arogenate dehydrogenase family protein [Vicinamibacterales bacterium]